MQRPNRNEKLVARIVEQIMNDYELSLCINDNSPNERKRLRYFLYSGDRVIGAYTFQQSVTDVIFQIAFLKTEHLKADTLGRVIATGTNLPERPYRTTMESVMPEEVAKRRENGKRILRNLAAAAITAAIWEIVKKQPISETMSQERVDILTQKTKPKAA